VPKTAIFLLASLLVTGVTCAHLDLASNAATPAGTPAPAQNSGAASFAPSKDPAGIFDGRGVLKVTFIMS
jgi:hypothetical protein